MGQRLNLEIVSGELSLVNCYFHWSAYTDSAIEIVLDFISNYYEKEMYNRKAKFCNNLDENTEKGIEFSSLEKLEFVILVLEQMGARLNDQDLQVYNEVMKIIDPDHYKKHKNKDINRNKGIISFSAKEKQETRDWEEGRATIDIDTMIINFDVLCYYLPEFDEDLEDIRSFEESNQVKTLDINISRMTEEELHLISEAFANYEMIRAQDDYVTKIQ